MNGHVTDTLWEYALGTLSDGERSEVARHVAGCAECARELRSAEETLAMAALELPPESPSPELRERLMASTTGRFEGLLDRVAELWDLGRDKARALLDGVATAAWETSGLAGVELIHVEPGPRVAHADAGFVRFAPHTEFPHHSHKGDELQLVLEGVLVDNAGCQFRVGDRMFRPEGSSHSFVAGAEGGLIALLLVGGIEIDGVRYGVKKS